MGFTSMLDGTFGYDRTSTTALKILNSEDAFHFVDLSYIGSDYGHYAGSFNEEFSNY